MLKMNAKIEKLKDKITGEEAEDLALLQTAVEETRKAYQADYSAAAKRNWDAAKDGLAGAIAGLEARYLSVEPPFATRTEALKYLQGQGYKIKKSKLYNDAKAGLLAVQADGTVLKADVSDYILRGDLKRTSDEFGNMSKTQAEKLVNENEKLKIQIEKLRFDFEKDKKLHILRSDAETATAVKIGALESGLKHLAMIKAVDWIVAVGGDPKKVRVWQELFYADVDDLLHEFGNMDEIEVLVRKGGK